MAVTSRTVSFVTQGDKTFLSVGVRGVWAPCMDPGLLLTVRQSGLSVRQPPQLEPYFTAVVVLAACILATLRSKATLSSQVEHL